MTSEPSLGLDEKQTAQLYTAMVGAFGAIIHFLDEVRLQYEDQVTVHKFLITGFPLDLENLEKREYTWKTWKYHGILKNLINIMEK